MATLYACQYASFAGFWYQDVSSCLFLRAWWSSLKWMKQDIMYMPRLCLEKIKYRMYWKFVSSKSLFLFSCNRIWQRHYSNAYCYLLTRTSFRMNFAKASLPSFVSVEPSSSSQSSGMSKPELRKRFFVVRIRFSTEVVT